MRDILIFLGIVFLTTLAAAGVVWIRRHQLEVQKAELAEANERRRREGEEKRKLEEKIAAGTHTETGRPRCKIAGCQREAGFQRARIVQDELAFRAWVRRQFGAPRRWEAVVGGPPDYCSVCGPLGSQVVEHDLSQSAQTVAQVILEEDSRLAWQESDGVDARVAELNQARASMPPPSSIKAVRAVGRLA
jgi:hypothetical protein